MDEASVNTSTQPLPAGGCEATKGAMAREKMLHAALDVFGRFGFDGATTRMLAHEAGMNLGAIPYYFGSKEDLYAQAADYLAQAIETRQSPLLAELIRTTTGETDRATLCDRVVVFLIAQAKIFLEQDVPISWMQFFMRAQGGGGPAVEHLNRRVIVPTQNTLSPLIGRIIARTEDDPNTLTLTFLALHQTLHIRLHEATLLTQLRWHDITPERMNSLLNTIGVAIKSQLLNFPPPLTSHP